MKMRTPTPFNSAVEQQLKEYIEDGVRPTSLFLVAVLQNKLVEAYLRADSNHVSRMRDIASYMYNQVPMGARGSDEAINTWCANVREELGVKT